MGAGTPELSLSDGQWEQIETLEELLKHPYFTTKNIQSEDLTLGKFL